MRRILPLLCLFLALPLPAGAAEAVTATQLDENPEGWDGREVVVRGELVGDYGMRRDEVWVQLNDDPHAEEPLRAGGELAGVNTGLGLRIPRPLFDPGWGTPGRYGVQGPLVEAFGVFRYHDPAHLGETYLDVTEIVVIQRARELPGEADLWTWWVGVGLLAVGLFLFLLARRRGRARGML